LSYDPSIWLKVTSLSSTASVLKDGRISLEIPSFYLKKKISKRQNKMILAILIDFMDLSGSEKLSDLNRNDKITGLNDLDSLFSLKK
jgi:hypothetical protein